MTDTFASAPTEAQDMAARVLAAQEPLPLLEARIRYWTRLLVQNPNNEEAFDACKTLMIAFQYGKESAK